MNEQLIHSKITSMELDVLKAVKQRTLENFTEGPSVERARLFFLLLPFFDENHWSGEIEASAKTVSIVYAALHAHDQVKENALVITKKQQLTVLAGDFYSGIYYQMLANSNNITMIQRLATSIIKVSENKASFYDGLVRSVEEIDDLVHVIETELLTTFYKFYGFEKYASLATLMLRYIRYVEELEFLQNNSQTRILRLLNQTLQHPLQTERWLLEKLDLLHEDISLTINSYNFNYELKSFMLHQITPHQHRAEQLTREG
ncbi:heptaprenyl diphosphate synthase component 1 [Planococcus shenhongbingii]|uniref:heptaprenyl diphosphate synthase component 1 n=1 Tax=Planococcus shenhongbingii TaxID=3058398 RepID=UPI002624AC4D|nr:heptaprenyl diphosphate synthase component 1 [Planococcus sp. N016]WKA57234.1 heptaprenyl diphosphate synthase component 1 [Planococcus sp. N016]